MSHRSVSTGRPDSAWNVVAVTKRVAASVITTSTTIPAFTKQPRELRRLVRGDAAGDAEHDARQRRRGGPVFRRSSRDRLFGRWEVWRGEVYTPRPRDHPPRLASLRAAPARRVRIVVGAAHGHAARAQNGPASACSRCGPAALTDAELLAVMLRTGVAGARRSPSRAACSHTSAGRSHCSPPGTAEIRAQQGIGPARAAEFKAMVEFVRRSLLEEAAHRDVLTSPDAVRDYLRLTLAPLPYEAFSALFLDSQNRLLAARELFRGTLAQTSVYPREVVKAALAHNAAGVIFAHNHPSGVAEPSRADELLTGSLKQALALVDIRTLDHFVVAGHPGGVVRGARAALTARGASPTG